MMEHFSSQWFNAFCAGAHFMSGVVMLVAAISPVTFGVDGKVQLCLPEPSSMNQRGDCVDLWNPSIFSFLGAFSLITSVFHAIYFVLDGNHRTSLRFVEYSVTATIMAVIIAILTSIDNVYTLIGIAGLTMSTMLFGLIQENAPAGTTAIPFVLGCVPYLFMWIIISWQFIRAATTLDVPDFVVAIFVLEVLLFSSFAVVQYLNKVMDKRIGDKAADGVYNLLSLTSKMILVWVSFGGILGQQSNS